MTAAAALSPALSCNGRCVRSRDTLSSDTSFERLVRQRSLEFFGNYYMHRRMRFLDDIAGHLARQIFGRGGDGDVFFCVIRSAYTSFAADSMNSRLLVQLCRFVLRNSLGCVEGDATKIGIANTRHSMRYMVSKDVPPTHHTDIAATGQLSSPACTCLRHLSHFPVQSLLNIICRANGPRFGAGDRLRVDY